MYTGNNKTALCSQRQIAAAFSKLLEDEPWSKITVNEICREANVSRQTFYSLFESRENIVIYILNEKHNFQPGETCTKSEMSLRTLCREYSIYITEREAFLARLVDNGLTYIMHDCLADAFLSCGCFMHGQSTLRRKYAAEYVAGALSGITKIYVKESPDMTADELENVIYSLFSGAFFER